MAEDNTCPKCGSKLEPIYYCDLYLADECDLWYSKECESCNEGIIVQAGWHCPRCKVNLP